VPPTKIKYTRPRLYDYQTAILDSPARYTCTEASTKVGKTASHIVWLFEEALKCTNNQSVWWVAPTFSQAKIAFDRMKVQISNRDFYKANESSMVITLVTGVKIQFKTGEKPDNLYGDDVYAVVVDEASRCRELAWHALRTTITSTGGKVKFIGNVRGRKNWFYKMCQRAKERDSVKNGGQYEYFKITAYDAAAAGMMTKDGRPFIEEIEEARHDLPDSVFNELYLAEASEDGSNPFGLTHIAGCIRPVSMQPTICYGIDLAKSVDWTAIIGLDKQATVSDLRHFQRSWTSTTDEIKSLPDRPMAMDSTGAGDPITEEVQRYKNDVEAFVFTQRTKQQLMEGLALAIQKRLISFPEGVIRTELESFEYEYTRTGVKYSAPAGEHDDTVCALALAWHKWQTASMASDGPSIF
jgi:phage FluMu gp28-like protein